MDEAEDNHGLGDGDEDQAVGKIAPVFSHGADCGGPSMGLCHAGTDACQANSQAGPDGHVSTRGFLSCLDGCFVGFVRVLGCASWRQYQQCHHCQQCHKVQTCFSVHAMVSISFVYFRVYPKGV